VSIFRKKVKLGRSYLAGNTGLYHLYNDCTAISGTTKRIYGSDFLNYNSCSTCTQRNNNIIHEYAEDLQKNEGNYMTELMDNVDKSELLDNDKLYAARWGLICIRMTSLLWSSLDNFPRKDGEG